MTTFPATQNTGNLIKFISEISGLGIPSKLTTTGLASYGYTSSHDRSIVGVLRFIEFLDGNGSPTELWKLARTKPKEAVAKGMLAGYKALYQHFPNAHSKDNETLINFFKSKTDVGESTVKKIASTFKALADYADFTEADGIDAASDQDGIPEAVSRSAVSAMSRTSSGATSGMTINLNIELSLPSDEDGKVYDAFFKSMKKHLMNDG